MATLDSALAAVKDATNSLNNAKNEPTFVKALFLALYSLLQAVDSASETALVSNATLSILEDVCSAKTFNLSRTLITAIVSIYAKLATRIPGYGVRNIIGNFLALLNNKTATQSCKECSIAVMGEILRTRALDCGSQITDIMQAFLRIFKVADTSQRITCLKALKSVLIGGGLNITDVHVEVLRTVGRYNTDKNPEVRQLVAENIALICKFSAGFNSVPADQLLSNLAKGLEDEIAVVQDAYITATAIIYVEQIRIFTAAQEQSKIGLARGGSSDDASKPPAGSQQTQTRRMSMNLTPRLSIAKLRDFTNVVSGGQKKVEENDYKTILSNVLKNAMKSTPILRAAHLSIASHIIKELIESVDDSDCEWTLQQILVFLHDPSSLSMTSEDLIFLKSRLSYIIRESIIANLVENKQITFASYLTQFIASVEMRSDLELQLALSELCHVINVLGETAQSILDDIHMATSVHLRHASYGVRSAAALVLEALGKVAPAVAARFVSNALTNADTQVKSLTSSQDMIDATQDPTIGLELHDEGTLPETPQSTKRRSPKDIERLQRMYCFHGHILVMSMLLKSESSLPTGLPRSLVLDVFSFGLSLLQYDVFGAPAGLRHVICSIIRAGSLLVSSCLNVTSAFSGQHFRQLVTLGNQLVKSVTANPSSQDDDLLYEIMTLEAALVCLSTVIICTSAHSLQRFSLYKELIVESLEVAFRAIKSKYQPRFRTHFRFRTLHVILLECFSWLPPDSFPNCVQPIFVETLRVFRDCISSNFECTCLREVLPKEYLLFGVTGVGNLKAGDTPDTERHGMLKLETFAVALQKKESEAFLSVFNRDNFETTIDSIRCNYNDSSDASKSYVWFPPISPSANIDFRTIDASIMTLSAIFSQQSHDYQEKAVQLFNQALTQVQKPTGNSNTSAMIFASSEETKKKDRKNYITFKNVITAICYTMRTLSSEADPSITPGNKNWVSMLLEKLMEVLNQSQWDLKVATSFALCELLSKCRKSGDILDSCYSKLSKSLSDLLQKKGENLQDCAGHVILLGKIWVVGQDVPYLRDRVISTLLECLRRFDTSLQFRSGAMFALHMICDEIFKNHTKMTAAGFAVDDEWIPTLENIAHVIELHCCMLLPPPPQSSTNFLSTQTTDDFETFVTIVSQVNASLGPMALRCSSGRRTVMKNIVGTSLRLLDTISRTCFHIKEVQQSHFDYLREASPFLSVLSELNESGLNILTVSIIYNQWAAVLCSHDNIDHSVVLSVVQSVSGALECSRLQVSQTNLDIALWLCLQRISSQPYGTVSTALSGLESRSFTHWKSLSALKLKLDKAIRDTILKLIERDVVGDVDRKLCYWLLNCRNIALNIRDNNGGTGNGNVDGTGNATNDNEGSGPEPSAPSSFDFLSYNNINNLIHNSNLVDVFPESASIGMSRQSFSVKQAVSMVKEYSVSRVQPLANLRIALKSFAVKCAVHALNAANFEPKSERFERHTNYVASHRYLNQFMRSMAQSNNAEITIFEVPFLSVQFMQDLINFACAIASFTIHEKRILSLLENSMKVLSVFVTFFKDTTENKGESESNNNAINNNNNNNNIGSNYFEHLHTELSDMNGDQMESGQRVLTQFISQILSAIRPAFQENYSAVTLANAGQIIFDMLYHRFISDKIIIKRLLKSTTTFVEENSFSEDFMSKFHSQKEVSEDIYSEVCVTHSLNTSKLFMIANVNDSLDNHGLFPGLYKNSHGKSSNDSVSETILSCLSPSYHKLALFWKYTATDALRLVYVNENCDEQSLHAKKGGYTFSKFIESESLFDVYRWSKYTNVSAYVLLKLHEIDGDSSAEMNQTLDQLDALFAMVFMNLNQLTNDKCEHRDMYILYSLYSFSYILKYQSNVMINNASLMSLERVAKVINSWRELVQTIANTHLATITSDGFAVACCHQALYHVLHVIDSLSQLCTLYDGLLNTTNDTSMEDAVPSNDDLQHCSRDLGRLLMMINIKVCMHLVSLEFSSTTTSAVMDDNDFGAFENSDKSNSSIDTLNDFNELFSGQKKSLQLNREAFHASMRRFYEQKSSKISGFELLTKVIGKAIDNNKNFARRFSEVNVQEFISQCNMLIMSWITFVFSLPSVSNASVNQTVLNTHMSRIHKYRMALLALINNTVVTNESAYIKAYSIDCLLNNLVTFSVLGESDSVSSAVSNCYLQHVPVFVEAMVTNYLQAAETMETHENISVHQFSSLLVRGFQSELNAFETTRFKATFALLLRLFQRLSGVTVIEGKTNIIIAKIAQSVSSTLISLMALLVKLKALTSSGASIGNGCGSLVYQSLCSCRDNEVLAVTLQSNFILIATFNEPQKTAFVSTYLTLLVQLFEGNENALVTNYGRICGLGLTNLARIDPESIKTSLMSLNDAHKATLQNIMRVALQSQMQSHSNGSDGIGSNRSDSNSVNNNNGINNNNNNGGNNNNATTLKKIDMSRYKK